MFSSIYTYKSLFLITNLIKSKDRTNLISETIAACVPLKMAMYTDIKMLFAKRQHKIIKYMTRNLWIFNKTLFMKL